jgi:hypothetical protein
MSVEDSEREPLLVRHEQRKQQKTSLPKLQLAVVFLLQVAEPVSSQVIFPFINQVSVLIAN